VNTDAVQPLDSVEDLKRQCQDRAFRAFGTASIFERRTLELRRRLRVLSFMGIVVPVVVGSAALAWGAGFRGLAVLVAIGGGVGLVQVVLSVWSLTAGWVDAHEYANSSVTANQRLYRDYRSLADNSPSDPREFRLPLGFLIAADDAREEQDNRQGITPAEKRFGMRSALRMFQRACSSCRQVPTSMDATECGVCGNFRFRF
jgi:mobilome CxxCx(11)CxxC protein